MAIREEHDPKNRGISGKFRKAKAKAGKVTSGVGGFARDYAEDYHKNVSSQLNDGGVLLTMLSTMLGTLGGGFAGVLIGGVVAMNAQPDIENAELPYGIEGAEGYEAIRTSNGTYVLVQKDGEYHLYTQNWRNDVLIYTDNAGDALEIMDRVTDRNLLFGGASPSYAKATAGRLPRVRVAGRGGDLRLRVEF